MTTKRKDPRGGVRPGAGAPTKDPQHVRVKYNIRLPQWMVDQLDAMCTRDSLTRAEAAEKALKRVYKSELSEP